MQNQALLEMLAIEKCKENMRLALQERMAAQVARESSSPLWKMILSWVDAG